jgi:hypothetical protein
MGMKVVSRIRELSHNVAGRDGVDFGGVKLWNQEAISWIAVAIFVATLWGGVISLL